MNQRISSKKHAREQKKVRKKNQKEKKMGRRVKVKMGKKLIFLVKGTRRADRNQTEMSGGEFCAYKKPKFLRKN